MDAQTGQLVHSTQVVHAGHVVQSVAQLPPQLLQLPNGQLVTLAGGAQPVQVGVHPACSNCGTACNSITSTALMQYCHCRV